MIEDLQLEMARFAGVEMTAIRAVSALLYRLFYCRRRAPWGDPATRRRRHGSVHGPHQLCILADSVPFSFIRLSAEIAQIGLIGPTVAADNLAAFR